MARDLLLSCSDSFSVTGVGGPHVLQIRLQARNQLAEPRQRVLHVLERLLLLCRPPRLFGDDGLLEVDLQLHLSFVLHVVDLQLVIDLLQALEILDHGLELLELLGLAHIPLRQLFDHILGAQGVIELLPKIFHCHIRLRKLLLADVELFLDVPKLLQVFFQRFDLVPQLLLLLLRDVSQPDEGLTEPLVVSLHLQPAGTRPLLGRHVLFELLIGVAQDLRLELQLLESFPGGLKFGLVNLSCLFRHLSVEGRQLQRRLVLGLHYLDRLETGLGLLELPLQVAVFLLLRLIFCLKFLYDALELVTLALDLFQ